MNTRSTTAIDRIRQADEMKAGAINELMQERQQCEQRIADIDAMLKGSKGPKSHRGRPRKGDGQKMTTSDAIMRVLSGGVQMQVGDIVTKASEVKGTQIPKSSIQLMLMGLKKAGKVTSPARGVYKGSMTAALQRKA